MWTVFRFGLSGGGALAYERALRILRRAGFRAALPASACPDASFPAAVLADVRGSPDDVTRAIFSALREAGLRPIGVSGCALEERPPAERAARA